MRARLEESIKAQPGNRGRKRAHTLATFEFKRAPGGLVDAEFALQYLALSYALPGEIASAPDYFTQLELLAADASPQHADRPNSASGDQTTSEPAEQRRIAEAAKPMRDAYDFLRRVETSTRLITGVAEAALPSDSVLRDGVARHLGFASVQELERAVSAAMQAMRTTFTEVLGHTLR